MKLILHLLRKDIRQWWYELAVTLIVLFTAAFTAVEPMTGSIMLGVSFLFSYLSPVLLVLLVGRVIQSERWPSPVEDWRTRPISRSHILSAKALFLGLFIVFPCWLGYLIVFRSMGFGAGLWLQESPMLLFGALVLLVLPAAAVMAVTTNLGQAILCSVGLFLAAALVGSTLAWRGFSAAPPNFRLTALLLTLFSAIALAALYCQLIRNRTWVARGVLVVGWMAVACLASWRPVWGSSTVRDWLNPMPDTLRPMTMKILKPDHVFMSTAPGSRSDVLLLAFPAELTGVPENVITEASLASAVFRTADGSEYRFGMAHGTPATANRQNYTLMLPRRQYEEFSAQPVELDLQIWLYVYSNPSQNTVAVRDQRIQVGDLFACSPDPLMRAAPNRMADITCSSATSNLRRLEFSWPVQTTRILLPATAYGDDSFDVFRSFGGRALHRTVYSGNLMPFWRDGVEVQVRHYQTVYQWHKTVHLSGIRLDDFRQTD